MEARLIPYGTIDYTLPKGAEAAITGLSYQDTLKEELSSEHDRQRVFKIASWVSLGIGVGSFGGMGYSLYMGNETYNSYLDAQTSDEAVSLREEALTYQTEMEKPYSYRSLFRRHRELDYLN